jgi:hypothetical protein
VIAALLAGGAGGLVVALALLLIRAFVLPRLARRRVDAAAFRLMYRPVVPTDAAEVGSLCYIAHAIERGLPAHLRGSYRASDDPRLEVGHVRVTFDVGTRPHRLASVGRKQKS